MTVPGTRPTAYTGLKERNPPDIFFRDRDPDNVTFKDFRNYDIGDEWQNTQTGQWFKMVSKKTVVILTVSQTQGVWAPLTNSAGGGEIGTINGISPDINGEFGITADPGIIVTPGTNAISIGANVDGVTIGFNGFNQLTVLSAPSGVIWNEILVNTAALVNNGYVCNAGGPLTVTLPVVFAFGDIIEITDKGLNGFIVQTAAGDIIVYGGNFSTIGGGWSTTNLGNTVRLLAVTANDRWDVINSNGNFVSF